MAHHTLLGFIFSAWKLLVFCMDLSRIFTSPGSVFALIDSLYLYVSFLRCGNISHMTYSRPSYIMILFKCQLLLYLYAFFSSQISWRFKLSSCWIIFRKNCRNSDDFSEYFHRNVACHLREIWFPLPTMNRN